MNKTWKRAALLAVLIVAIVVSAAFLMRAAQGPKQASSGKMWCNTCRVGFYADAKRGAKCPRCGGTNTQPLPGQ